MRSRFLLLATPILIAFAIAGSAAIAQEVTVPLPGDSIAPDADPSSAAEIPDPAAILEDDGSTVSVPIPGGGEIMVDGPESEASTNIGPTENWLTRSTNPSSVGTTPMGPIPQQ
jgi:hypothetical protein